MTYDQLKQLSWNELGIKTSGHQGVWRFGEEENWDFAQDTGVLVFEFANGLEAHCPAQIIGTFNTIRQTWMWAWNNSSIAPDLCRDALTVREYGEQNAIAELTEPLWEATEMDAWQMTAIAARLCNAQGAYRGPSGSTPVFFTFGEVKLARSPDGA